MRSGADPQRGAAGQAYVPAYLPIIRPAYLPIIREVRVTARPMSLREAKRRSNLGRSDVRALVLSVTEVASSLTLLAMTCWPQNIATALPRALRRSEVRP